MSRFGLGFIASAAPPSIEFLSNTSSATDSASYSFASVPFGVADSTRYIVVGLAYRTANSGLNFSTVTIGGVSAPQIVNQSHGDGFGRTAFFGALVPSGTSGTVAFTLNGAAVRAAMVVYSFKNLTSTMATNTAAGTPPLAIDVSAGGFAIGMGYYAAGTGTSTWTGLSKDADASVEGAEYTSASATFVSAVTGQSVGLTVAGNSPGATVAIASFR